MVKHFWFCTFCGCSLTTEPFAGFVAMCRGRRTIGMHEGVALLYCGSNRGPGKCRQTRLKQDFAMGLLLPLRLEGLASEEYRAAVRALHQLIRSPRPDDLNGVPLDDPRSPYFPLRRIATKQSDENRAALQQQGPKFERSAGALTTVRTPFEGPVNSHSPANPAEITRRA